MDEKNNAVKKKRACEWTGAMEFSPPAVCSGIPGGSRLPLITSWAPLWLFSNRCLRGEKSVLVNDWHQWCTTTAVDQQHLPVPSCSMRHNHYCPRTKGEVWHWSLAEVCSMTGAESPFFLLIPRHWAGGALPVPHTTGLSHSRLLARATQCQRTRIYQTHTRGKQEQCATVTHQTVPFLFQ